MAECSSRRELELINRYNALKSASDHARDMVIETGHAMIPLVAASRLQDLVLLALDQLDEFYHSEEHGHYGSSNT